MERVEDQKTATLVPPKVESRQMTKKRLAVLIAGIGIGVLLSIQPFFPMSANFRATLFAVPTLAAAYVLRRLGRPTIKIEDAEFWKNHFKDMKQENLNDTQISKQFLDHRRYSGTFTEQQKGLILRRRSLSFATKYAENYGKGIPQDKISREGANEIVAIWKEAGLTDDEIEIVSHLCTMELSAAGRRLALAWYPPEEGYHVQSYQQNFSAPGQAEQEMSSIVVVSKKEGKLTVRAEQLMEVLKMGEKTMTFGYLKETLTIDVYAKQVDREFTPLLPDPPSLTP